jgi:hypothetical protein
MQGQQELRPYSRNFKPGEFSKLYETALETVDIVFLDGIDWKAFLVSFLELKAETGSDEISIKEYTFNGDVGSVENQGNIASSGNPNNIGNAAGEAQAEMKSIQHNYAPEQKQTLAEAAAEIQKLIQQLEETNPTATVAEKQSALAIEIQQEIKRNPNFKARLRNALKEGGIEALKVLFAPIGIPIEMARGWIEAEVE